MDKFDTVEEALEELRLGRVILVTDDEDRENEGDLICAAQFATTENVNFMATHGKGLICMPMSAELCRKLCFPQMVTENQDNHETAFKQGQRTSAGRGTCFLSWQEKTACWRETATQRRRWI